ncbi:hypothetical protein B0H13DRAFT_1538421, partial [Mycena leptocephala]
VHVASLVDPVIHAPALLRLIVANLDGFVFELIADRVFNTVDHALQRGASSSMPLETVAGSGYVAKAIRFVSTVLLRAQVAFPTVLVALVYIDRARPHLLIALREWAFERVFLGALIVAAKYTNDCTLRNAQWARCTGIFGERDIGRIEREFLQVLDWELGFVEADLLHFEYLVPQQSRAAHVGDRSVSDVSEVSPLLLKHRMRSTAFPDPERLTPRLSRASMSSRTP